MAGLKSRRGTFALDTTGSRSPSSCIRGPGITGCGRAAAAGASTGAEPGARAARGGLAPPRHWQAMEQSAGPRLDRLAELLGERHARAPSAGLRPGHEACWPPAGRDQDRPDGIGIVGEALFEVLIAEEHVVGGGSLLEGRPDRFGEEDNANAAVRPLRFEAGLVVREALADPPAVPAGNRLPVDLEETEAKPPAPRGELGEVRVKAQRPPRHR